MDDRIYPRLTPEEKHKFLIDWREYLERGDCMRKLQPPLIVSDWRFCEIRKFDGVAGQDNYRTPPEFIGYGFQSIDAYVAVIVAICFEAETQGSLTATCSLEQSPDGCLALRFAAKLDDHLLPFGERTMTRLLTTFPEALRGQGIESEIVFFLPGNGCPMCFKYPGDMQTGKTPYLDRPASQWPEVIVTLKLSPQLHNRATKIVDFLLLSTARAEPS